MLSAVEEGMLSKPSKVLLPALTLAAITLRLSSALAAAKEHER